MYDIDPADAVLLMNIISSIIGLIASVVSINSYFLNKSTKHSVFALFCLSFTIYAMGSVIYDVLVPRGTTVFEASEIGAVTATTLITISGFGAISVGLWLTFVYFHTTQIEKRTIIFTVSITVILYISYVTRSMLYNLYPITLENGVFKGASPIIINALRISSSIGSLGWLAVYGVSTSKLYSSIDKHSKSGKREILIGTFPITAILISFQLSGWITVRIIANLIGGLAVMIGAAAMLWTVKDSTFVNDKPVITETGQSATVSSIDSPVFILDSDGHIDYVNKSAKSVTSDSNIANKHINTILPIDGLQLNIQNIDGSEIYISGKGKYFTVNVSKTGGREELWDLGYTVILNEITDIKKNEQRISVLNRVLRHNLRNNLNAADGFAELAAESEKNVSHKFVNKHHSQTGDLVSKGDKARKIEQLLDYPKYAHEATDMGDLASRVVNNMNTPASTDIIVDNPREVYTTNLNPDIISEIIGECISNSLEHSNCGLITITIGEKKIVIEDDGSGIPEYELTVFNSDIETDLEHGSGLGLWLIRWCTEYLGGTVTITSHSGTRIEIVFD